MSARRTTITVASAAALALAVPAVKQFEGYAPTVVPDRLANGLPTGGYGETEGVKLGERHGEQYWSDRLAKRLAEDYDAGIGKCITVELPDSARAMAISTAYNAGISAVCRSPMVAKWNAGDFRGGCNAIRGWRIVSHPQGPNGPAVVQRGLVNRRNSEAAKCLAGIDQVPAPAPVVKPAPAPAPVLAAAKPAPAPKPCFLPWIFKCGGRA